MKNKIIICISIFGLLTAAIILSNIMEVRNKEYIESIGQLKENDASTTLFKYLPVNGWSDEDAKP